MKKYCLVMISCIGMSFFTSYSMDMFACVQSVKQGQRAGKFPHITFLEKNSDTAFAQLGKEGVDQEEAYENWDIASGALWQAQLKEAKRLKEQIKTEYFLVEVLKRTGDDLRKLRQALADANALS